MAVGAGVGVEEVQDLLPAAVGWWGVPVVVGDGRKVGLGCENVDVEAGDRTAGTGTAVGLAFGIPGI